MSRDTFLGLLRLMSSYVAQGVRMTCLIHVFVLLANLLGCMMVHALTKVRACSHTSSYIISVNIMTIFHGFSCHPVVSVTQHKHR